MILIVWVYYCCNGNMIRRTLSVACTVRVYVEMVSLSSGLFSCIKPLWLSILNTSPGFDVRVNTMLRSFPVKHETLESWTNKLENRKKPTEWSISCSTLFHQNFSINLMRCLLCLGNRNIFTSRLFCEKHLYKKRFLKDILSPLHFYHKIYCNLVTLSGLCFVNKSLGEYFGNN